VISSANGLPAVTRAMEMLRGPKPADALDAVVAGVSLVEDDPNDHSVGLGGLPNEDGVVELDASCMHGPTARAGAVAALRNVKNAASVARLVLHRTDHVLLVGEGALRFAKAHGFQEENLLTDEAREMWLWWKEHLSDTDKWLAAPPEDYPENVRIWAQTTGTIHCSAIDANGDISATTTTSGLAFKIPGRVGDSPIIGAGNYVDNDVGSCGSTGRGEELILNAGSFAVVERMRNGATPRDACLEILKRLVAKALKTPRLRAPDGKPNFDAKLYALNKAGEHAGVAMWSGAKYAVHDGTEAKLVDCEFLYEAKKT
jgi:N4-(beta-N-acetylglucosaminyl)-L-asparaginase